MKKKTLAEVKEELRTKVHKTEAGCWEWAGGLNGRDRLTRYGCTWVSGRKYKTHRLAYELNHGLIPEGMIVCHKCDNPPCVNPDHLFLGTWKDNAIDCTQKGRATRERGEDRYNATLTEEDIRTIRREYVPRNPDFGGVAMAKRFGVGGTMISAIVHGRRWKHVE